jgi:hypothetical protein
METHNEGKWGWLAIGAFVVAWDTLSPDSLTGAFRRGIHNPNLRPYIVAGLGITTLHLLDALPEQVDPFYIVQGAAESLVEHIPLRINLDNLNQ